MHKSGSIYHVANKKSLTFQDDEESEGQHEEYSVPDGDKRRKGYDSRREAQTEYAERKVDLEQ